MSRDEIPGTNNHPPQLVRNEDNDEVLQIPVRELYPFKNHPYQIRQDEDMVRLMESVAENGVLTPALAQPRPEGGYELISGHRRLYACRALEIDSIPVMVRDLDDDTATIMMVNSNVQRETILPSERAFAYRMKLEAMNHQGKSTSSQVGAKLRTDEFLAKQAGTSRNQVQRYVRLTELIPQILTMVDEKQIGLNTAYEISFLSKEHQIGMLDAIGYAQCFPSQAQAQRMRKLEQDGLCTSEAMCAILSEERKSDLDRVVLKSDTLQRYFPKGTTPKAMQQQIIRLLDAWQKRRSREMER